MKVAIGSMEKCCVNKAARRDGWMDGFNPNIIPIFGGTKTLTFLKG
jgi:hypothetical protein